MQAVSDATPLIHLSKIGKISHLKDLFDKIFIPREIYEEVVAKGKELNKKEVVLIEELIREEVIIVKETISRIEMPNLHIGELKAMALCNELKIKNLLIDEKEGYDAAEIIGLNPIRTTALLLRSLNKKFIKFDEYKESLLALSESGYFLSAEAYERLLEAGRKAKYSDKTFK